MSQTKKFTIPELACVDCKFYSFNFDEGDGHCRLYDRKLKTPEGVDIEDVEDLYNIEKPSFCKATEVTVTERTPADARRNARSKNT